MSFVRLISVYVIHHIKTSHGAATILSTRKYCIIPKETFLVRQQWSLCLFDNDHLLKWLPIAALHFMYAFHQWFCWHNIVESRYKRFKITRYDMQRDPINIELVKIELTENTPDHPR